MALLRDARHAVRLLLKAPGYTTAAVVTLALAVGANSAVFGVVHTVLLEPLPIERPEDLVMVWETDQSRNLSVVELSYRSFQRWAAHTTSFSQTAAMGSSVWSATLRRSGEFLRVATTGVSGSFFDTLGAVPLLGRTLRPDDDVPYAPAVAVLSYGAWSTHFGEDPSILGKTIELDGPLTVVGVMPKGFDFPRGTDVWIPVAPALSAVVQSGLDPLEDIGVLFVLGRLRASVSGAEAAAELDALARASTDGGVPSRFGNAVVVTPFLDYLLGPVRHALWVLWTAVGVLLLIACANISGLMLTRVAIRHRDHAIRLALGARPGHVGRIWALESLGIAMAGGVLGLLICGWLLKGIVALAPGDVPRLADVSLSPVVALFTLGAMLMTALLCGLGPARHARGANLADLLNDAARATPGRRSQRMRSGLVVIQIALAVVLLVGAGLVVRSFVALRQLDVGFVSSGVVTMHVEAPSNQWMHELVQRLEASPRIASAGAVFLRPLEHGPIGAEVPVVLAGQADTPRTRRNNPALNYQVATPGYFTAMGIRLVGGRSFSPNDGPRSPPVAIVGERTARQLWPSQDPIGKRILLPTEGEAWRTVVGVVADVHYRGLGDVRLDVYNAALQSPTAASYLVVRTTGDPIAAVSAVRTEAQRLDPGVVIDAVTTLDAVVSRASAPWHFSTWMLTLFAVFGFLLAAVGLFSIVSLDVANRRHELAVRVALGARRADLLRAVWMPAASRILTGVSAGALGAAAGARGLRGFLFGVAPLDATTWMAVLLLVVLVVGLASYLPSRRADEVDPIMLLRSN